MTSAAGWLRTLLHYLFYSAALTFSEIRRNNSIGFFPVEEVEVGGLTARKERTATTSYKEPYKATTDTEKRLQPSTARERRATEL